MKALPVQDLGPKAAAVAAEMQSSAEAALVSGAAAAVPQTKAAAQRAIMQERCGATNRFLTGFKAHSTNGN